MSADVIDLAVRRETTEAAPRFYSSEHYAEVREFHSKIALCGRCGSASHRASKCPLNKRASGKRDTLRLGD